MDNNRLSNNLRAQDDRDVVVDQLEELHEEKDVAIKMMRAALGELKSVLPYLFIHNGAGRISQGDVDHLQDAKRALLRGLSTLTDDEDNP